MLIRLLGTVSVNVDGVLRDIRAGKVRAMLATLALDPGRPVSYDDLATELWSGRSLSNARNAVQAHAARLRKLIDGPDGIVVRAVPNGYLLDVAPEDVDGSRFLALAARGAALVRTDPHRAIDLLKESMRLWHGPALLDAGDGLRCRSAAALLEERKLGVWEDITTARLAVGDNMTAAADLGPLVAQHPLREVFCEQLMLALYRCGRQSDALAAFHRIRVRLGEELGLQPGGRLRQRYADILAQDPALAEGQPPVIPVG